MYLGVRLQLTGSGVADVVAGRAAAGTVVLLTPPDVAAGEAFSTCRRIPENMSAWPQLVPSRRVRRKTLKAL